MNRQTELTLLAGVVITGIATVILGAALPMLRARYGVSEAELGRLFAAQFAGSALAATFSLKRPRFSIITGFQLIALGLASAGLSSWTFAPIAVLVYGIGLGLVLPSANVAVAFARESGRGASLSLLNLAWGLGAAATPLLFLASHGHNLVAAIYLSTAVASSAVGVALSFLLTTFPQPRTTPATGEDRLDPRILLHGFGFALYVGSESCVGGWTSEYVFRTFATPRIATSAIAAFWIALLAARAAAPAILKRISEPQMLRISLLLSLAGVLVMFAAPLALVVTLGAFCVGIGMASVFGILVGNATTYAEHQRVKVPGWLFTCASIGGATLPWLFGVIASKSSLRMGLILPILALLLLTSMNAGGRSRQTFAAG